jgi:hypothetical protein
MELPLTPKQRTMRARMAAHVRWAKSKNPHEDTRPGRDAFMERFRREADPESLLPEAERERRAKHLMKAHFTRMAFDSSKARRKDGRCHG